MAENIFKKINKNPNYLAQSAGISVLPGMPPTNDAILTMKEQGINISKHKSRQLTRKLIDESDYIFVMTNQHLQYVRKLKPAKTKKIFLLKPYSKNTTRGENVGRQIDNEINDPIGKGTEYYRFVAKELTYAVTGMINKLKEKINIGEGDDVEMKIAIGSDHGGYLLKENLKMFLKDLKIEFKDFGCFSELSIDYPDIAVAVSTQVINGDYQRGILICGTGIGMSIAANKMKGIRAALCSDVFSAKMAREHNDSNILALGGRVLGIGLAMEIVKAWLFTDFAFVERHVNRLKKVAKIENYMPASEANGEIR